MANVIQSSLQFEEIWKDVNGFEGRFKISNFGRILSLNGRLKRDIILTPSIDCLGYRALTLRKTPLKRKVRVHTLVGEHFLVNPHLKVRQTINHIDGNKLNNHVSNLEWISAAENCAHAVRIGLYNIKGSKHPQAKVNEEQVLEMRKMHDEGYTSTQIANKFGISPRNTRDIVSKRLWKHI